MTARATRHDLTQALAWATNPPKINRDNEFRAAFRGLVIGHVEKGQDGLWWGYISETLGSVGACPAKNKGHAQRCALQAHLRRVRDDFLVGLVERQPDNVKRIYHALTVSPAESLEGLKGLATKDDVDEAVRVYRAVMHATEGLEVSR